MNNYKSQKSSHNILSTSDNEMNQKVLMAQSNNPTKDDWTEQVKLDLKEFQIEADLIKITKNRNQAETF